MRQVIFCVGLLCVLPGATAQPPAFSLEQLAQAADVVVRGVVTSTTCQRDAGGRIITRVQFRAVEYWKGATSNIPIVHAGGVLGEQAVVAQGQERYVPGEEFIAFLTMNERGEGITLGMAQGKFNVWKEGAKTFASSPANGTADGPKAAIRRTLSLEALKQLVLGGGR